VQWTAQTGLEWIESALGTSAISVREAWLRARSKPGRPPKHVIEAALKLHREPGSA
jgi:hypothetical protein